MEEGKERKINCKVIDWVLLEKFNLVYNISLQYYELNWLK